MSLLKEINDLRRELKISRTNVHDLEAAMKIARKSGFDDQGTLAVLRVPPPPSGLGKIEPTDDSRLIEIQKMEIAKLRERIRELERVGSTKMTGPGTKLPSLQPIPAQ